MNKFVKAMQNEENKTYTENGAFATKSTNSYLLDLFGVIGSLRGRKNSDIWRLFSKAFAEDNLLATKMMFYARDIRGGLGERDTFRVILNYLAITHPSLVYENMGLIPFYGRWDDLYSLIGTPLEKTMWEMIKYQIEVDRYKMGSGEPISLLAKWLKSVNTSNKESNRLGKLTARHLGLSEKSYRQILSKMRAYIDVTEVKMSAGAWEEINYPSVPSYAMKNYREAFKRNDTNRFEKYIDLVSSGEEKINASTLYPYDILEGYNVTMWGSHLYTHNDFDKVLEAQWKALPNYIEGENNVLVMADTSGSMYGRPLNTAVGLAVYFAERNKGVFKDVFMTFSSKPSFVTLVGETLRDKISCIPSIIENTDLEKAFDLILEVALENNITPEELPKSLVVISDMEFDQASGRNNKLFYDKMTAKFESHNYKIPNIVFWNVDSRNDVFHVKSDYAGVQLVSGQSVSTFKNVLNSIGKTPYESMLDTLNSDRYSLVTSQ